MPVINVLSLSSKTNPNYLLCGNGAGPCKHFSFVIWHNVKLSREPWLPLKGKETSLPGSYVLTWQVPAAHGSCTCGNQHISMDSFLQYPKSTFPAAPAVWHLSMNGFPQSPKGMLSSEFHLHGTLVIFIIQWDMTTLTPTRYQAQSGGRRWGSGPHTGLFLSGVLCFSPKGCSLYLL